MYKGLRACRILTVNSGCLSVALARTALEWRSATSRTKSWSIPPLNPGRHSTSRESVVWFMTEQLVGASGGPAMLKGLSFFKISRSKYFSLITSNFLLQFIRESILGDILKTKPRNHIRRQDTFHVYSRGKPFLQYSPLPPSNCFECKYAKNLGLMLADGSLKHRRPSFNGKMLWHLRAFHVYYTNNATSLPGTRKA